MRIQCTKDNLIRALDSVVSITRKGGSLPILSHCLIKAEQNSISLQATNLEIGLEYIIRGKVEEDGSVALPAKLFSDAVRSLYGNLEIQGNENSVNIIGEKSHIVVHGLPSDDFPSIPWFESEKRISLLTSDFIHAIKKTIYAASHEGQRQELISLCLTKTEKGLACAATDGFRLSEVIIPTNSDSECEKILLPLATAQLLERLLEVFDESITLMIKDGEMSILGGNCKVYTRLIQGKYPDYKAIIPSKAPYFFALSSKELINAIKTASLFCRPGINDISLQLTEHKCTIKGKSEVIGKSESEVDCIGSQQDITIIFNYRYILDAVINSGEEWVIFFITHQHQPVLILPYNKKPTVESCEEFKETLHQFPRLSVVMPIRQ